MDPITLIIVAHGRADVLRKTLAGLASCDQPATFRGTIVAENGPPCGMDDVVAEFSNSLRIEHLQVNDPRKSVALNTALRAAVPGWALFIDDDVRVSRSWMELYAAAFATSPQGHYFGGPTSVDYEQPPPEWLQQLLPSSARGLQFSEGTREIRYPSCFLGFNWAARTESLLKIGGFPEHVGPGTPYGGGDETFMQRRLAELGETGILIPEALVWHQIPANRCTPEWTLKRSYTSGQTKGIEAAWHDQEHPVRFARLRSHLRFFKHRMQYVPFLDLLRLRAAGIHGLKQALQWMSGFVSGYRVAQTQDLHAN